MKLNLRRGERFSDTKRPWAEVFLLRSLDWLGTAVLYFGSRYFTEAIHAARVGQSGWVINNAPYYSLNFLISIVPSLILGAAIVVIPFKIWVWIRLALSIVAVGAGIWQGLGDSLVNPPWHFPHLGL